MQLDEFEQIKADFQKADVDRKVTMYVEAQGLTQDQYKELLRMFPLDQLNKLEAALQ
ncbi:MAG: hypothetical protein LBV08_05300 [Clostridiales bacterium]|nr:hypothetical protein [Clostridiales bacterium]